MRQLFTISILLFGLLGFAQPYNFWDAIENQDYEDWAGASVAIGVINIEYDMKEDSTLKEDSAIVFTIVPGRWTSVKKTLSLDLFTEGKTIKIKDGFTHFLDVTLTICQCGDTIKTRPKDRIAFAVGVNPSTARELKKNDYVNGTYFYRYDSLISDARLLVKRVGQEPQDLDSNQYFLAAGGHTNFDKVYCGSHDCGGGRQLVLEVQVKLRSQGYDVPLDNKMTTATRRALLAYQNEHQLPVGNLNLTTLKHLGVEGY